MSSMFSNANSFNQILTFDTKKVKTMYGMFFNASSFNQVVNFDTRNVETMEKMFFQARAFNQVIHFDTRNVIMMTEMFSGARSFNQIVNFTILKVRSLDWMFKDAIAFNSYVLLSNSSHVQSMRGMFSGARAFNQPLVLDDTSTVIDFVEIFYRASTFDQQLNFNTRNARKMSRMFAQTAIVTSSFAHWQTDKVIECEDFCEFCGLPNFVNCVACTNARDWSRTLVNDEGAALCACPPGEVQLSPTHCGVNILDVDRSQVLRLSVAISSQFPLGFQLPIMVFCALLALRFYRHSPVFDSLPPSRLTSLSRDSLNDHESAVSLIQLVSYREPEASQVVVPTMLRLLQTLFECMRNPAWVQEKQHLCHLLASEARQLLTTNSAAQTFHQHLMPLLKSFVPLQIVSIEEKKWLDNQNWEGAVNDVREECLKNNLLCSSNSGTSFENNSVQVLFREDVKRYVERDKRMQANKMKDSVYAAAMMVALAFDLASGFCEVLKPAVGFQALKDVVKLDQLRIVEKISDYANMHRTELGYLYLKDLIRMMFFYNSVDSLIEALFKLFTHHRLYETTDAEACYTILEVKCKLLTVLRNITLIVGFSDTNGARIMGEIQLVACFARETEDDHFSEHIIYELRRMWGPPDDIKTEFVTSQSKALLFRRIMLKIYSYEFSREESKLEFLDGNEFSRACDIPSLEVMEGGSKQVFKHFWQSKQLDVAVGQLKSSSTKERDEFFREADLVSKLSHENIVKVHGVCYNPPRIIMEWCDNNLQSCISNNLEAVEFNDAIRMFHDIAAGLRFIHAQGILHRDLKPENILICSNTGALKLGDFGSSKLATYGDENKYSKAPFTVNYSAPETVYDTPLYSHSADVYSCGMVFYFILTKKTPYAEYPSMHAVVDRIRNHELPSWEGLDSSLRPLVGIVECCWLERTVRPSAFSLCSQIEAFRGT